MIKPEIEIASVERMSSADWDRLIAMMNEFGCAHIRQTAEITSPVPAMCLLREPFGAPVFHKLSDEHGIHPIRYISGYPEYANANCEHLDLHTDGSFEQVPPTYMILYCKTPAEAGGDSLLASGDLLYSHLMKQHRDYVAALSRPAAFTITRDDRTAERSVFSPAGNRVRLAFRAGQDIRLSVHPEAATAFAYVQDWLRDLANCLHFKLRPGEILIFDNTRMLHGRTAFPRDSARSLYGLWCDGRSAPDYGLTPGIDPARALSDAVMLEPGAGALIS